MCVALRRSACEFVPFALASLWCGINARWIWLYRRGQPFDIDEAGYLAIALNDYHALVDQGFLHWVSVVLAPSKHAPLTAAAASLLFYGSGPHLIVGFVVPLLAGTCSIVGTYFLGRAVASRSVALAATVLVASCPVVLSYSRSFHFSMLATLVMTLLLIALVKSNRFDRIGWSAIFGVGLGLMPLARTMTIAFVPGVLVAAVVYAVAEPIDRRRRLLVLSGSVFLAVIIATTWLGPNGNLVFRYLFSFGYGQRAAEYGPEVSPLGVEALLQMLRAFCNHDVYLPHLLVILGGGAATVVATAITFRRQGASCLRRLIRSPMLPVVIVIAEALVALTFARNQGGSAFFAPLLPVLLVVSVRGFGRISSRRQYRRILLACLGALAVTTGVPFIDLDTVAAAPRSAIVPALGLVTMTNGRGTLQATAAAGALAAPDAAEVSPRAVGNAWIRLDKDTAAAIAGIYGDDAVVAFGFRHRLYNVNSVNVQHLLDGSIGFGLIQVEPTVTGDSVEAYVSGLVSDAANACVLVTADPARGQLEPVVNPVYMREAAERAAFVPIRSEEHTS